METCPRHPGGCSSARLLWLLVPGLSPAADSSLPWKHRSKKFPRQHKTWTTGQTFDLASAALARNPRVGDPPCPRSGARNALGDRCVPVGSAQPLVLRGGKGLPR